MEGDYLTKGDLALWENRRDDDDDGYCHHHGMSATGIGLAAGLGGGALLLAIAGLWGVNQASQARQRGSENTINALSNNIAQLSNIAAAERVSRESWQNTHAPTMTQYVDVKTATQANACSNAFATAQNQIVADALTGRSQLCPTPVSLYSAPRPCPCPTSDCNCGC